MDEPTNHLDIEMREAAGAGLQSFSGALIIVSHDRHLLKSTVDEYSLVDQGAQTFLMATSTTIINSSNNKTTQAHPAKPR